MFSVALHPRLGKNIRGSLHIGEESEWQKPRNMNENCRERIKYSETVRPSPGSPCKLTLIYDSSHSVNKSSLNLLPLIIPLAYLNQLLWAEEIQLIEEILCDEKLFSFASKGKAELNL